MTDSTSSVGRPRLYESSSEKVQAFRQRQASGGYLRREVLLSQAVADRVAELAKEHKVSTVDVTSALLEQGLTQFEATHAKVSSLGLEGHSLAQAGRGVAGALSPMQSVSGAAQAHTPTDWLATPHGAIGALRSQAFASAGSELVATSSSTSTPNPITDFFNRRKETLNVHKS